MAPVKTNGTTLPDMTDVFKSHPHPEVMQNTISTYRLSAQNYLQETMPEKITHLQNLLASETEFSSPLWKQHIHTEAFTKPVLKQPTEPDFKGVTPDQVVRAKGMDLANNENDTGEEPISDGMDGMDLGTKRGIERGIKVGPHWFEVIETNEIQVQLIKLAVKELEDLHTIAQDLRIWLELEVPVIEDGNHFDVQMALVKELLEAMKRANAAYNGCRMHHLDRLNLVHDWAKFPNMMDYPAAIALNDRFDHSLIRGFFRSLLNIYSSLLMKFERNWSKVISPKGSGGSGAMY